jgi:hypothetical protein
MLLSDARKGAHHEIHVLLTPVAAVKGWHMFEVRLDGAPQLRLAELS